MTNQLGFFSYVHADDENDGGRVAQLGRDILSELKAITGDGEVELFLDRDDLHAGDHWREKVDEALSNVAFFIPIITPRFFQSVECRRELQFFSDKAEKLGITEIILPILYIDVPELREIEPDLDLVRLIKRIQWEPWNELRLEGRESSDYLKGKHRIAQELNRRRLQIESKDIIPAATRYQEELNQFFRKTVSEPPSGTDGKVAPAEETEDEEPDIVGLLANMEDAQPKLTQVLSEISSELMTYGEIMSRGTEDIQKGNDEGKGFAWRLVIARRLTTEIVSPIERIEEGTRKYLSYLNEIDLGFRVLLPRLVDEVRDDPGVMPNVREFLRIWRGMCDAASGATDSILQMVELMKPLEKLSKDLRAPLRRMRTALVSMAEAQDVLNDWITMMDASGIEYSDETNSDISE